MPALMLIVLALFASPSPSPAAPPASRTVLIENYAFIPATLTIAPGTQVTWTNKDDDPHTVTADDGSFDSKGLGQGDEFRHTFTKAGRYAIHCAAHPFMKAVIIVKEGTAS
jgi:plastocyanin